MADININIETANGYKLEFNGPVVNMNVILSNYYTKTETDALLNDKADKVDTYTKVQSDTLLAGKQDTITGAATTITDNNLTANRSLTSNSNGKVDVATTTTTELNYVHGVTSAIQTQLNAKVSTSLDNLSSAGQMIIDSANGTISNCILEIPQNIKLTLENNVLTLKAGSIVTKTGSTYETITLLSDLVRSSTTFTPNRTNIVFTTNGTAFAMERVEKIGSGATLPADDSQYNWFFNTTDKKMYWWNNGNFVESNLTYPICVIIIDSNGVASFAKDANGNDMIFNGAGFIGHHAFVYPNVKALNPDGLNTDGSLKSKEYNISSLIIAEMGTNLHTITISNSNAVQRRNGYLEVKEYNSQVTIPQYIIPENIIIYNSLWRNETPLIFFTYNGTTVTDFTIRQPYEGARCLLTDEIKKQIGDVETLLAAI